MAQCRTCSGEGRYMQQCKTCRGKGWTTPDGFRTERCKTCGGSKNVMAVIVAVRDTGDH